MTGEADLVDGARRDFATGVTLPLGWRRRQLAGLHTMLQECEDELVDAVVADVGRDRMGVYLADLAPVRAELRHTRRRLARWAAPRRVGVPLVLRPGSAAVEPHPRGVVLVIGAWNFPLLLTLQPLVSALAAGNIVILKPSELAPATSAALARLLPRYLDPEAVHVVTGGVDVSTRLLDQRFDHICFTGSTAVGRVVAAAAARQLTPVTLELGGKNPAIVAADADLVTTARRIAWAKCLNAGQACLAPDFVMVEASVRDVFVDLLVAAVAEAGQGQQARIVRPAQRDRLRDLVRGSGGRLVGASSDLEVNPTTPIIVVDPAADCALMREEIFGPVLPVRTVPSVAEAISILQDAPNPLALYVFTRTPALADAVLAGVRSGTAVVNHALQQLLVPDLPFGGVGDSGMGAYHGRVGFDTFSHLRGVLRKPAGFDLRLMYPPYHRATARVLRRLLR